MLNLCKILNALKTGGNPVSQAITLIIDKWFRIKENKFFFWESNT